jgi:LacI family transcriptional regulator
MIEALAQSSVPFVRLTPCERCDGLPYVCADDYGGARAMTEYLLELGHTRIGFIIGAPIQVASGHRLSGYRDALEAAGLPADPALIRQGDFSYASGLAAARELLEAPAPPTAIFASNDDMAAGALAAAHERGLRVPDDLSITGFDDTVLAAQLTPALTTVHQPVYDSALLATQILVASLREAAPQRTAYVLPTRLVIRASTGPSADRR